jgi:hypothetical protein
MPVLNLCDPAKYYSTPYVSDDTSDKINRIPSSSQDINIIQTLEDNATLNLNSLDACELQNIASISVKFRDPSSALEINGSANINVTARSGETQPWIANHEEYDISDKYVIESISSLFTTTIKGILHTKEINTRTLNIENNGSVSGPLISAQNVNIKGSSNYIKFANITADEVSITASKARIDNSTFVCSQNYIQNGSDASLLNCNIVSPSATLKHGYFLASQILFGSLELDNGHIDAECSYDSSLVQSGSIPLKIKNTSIGANFKTNVPLLIMSGPAELNGDIKAILISGSVPNINIGPSGIVDVIKISTSSIKNSGQLTIQSITSGQSYTINNYGNAYINAMSSQSRLSIKNDSFANTILSDTDSIIESLSNEISGVIQANNLVINKSFSNTGKCNTISSIQIKGGINNLSGVIQSTHVDLFNTNNEGIISASTVSLSGSSINLASGVILGSTLFINKTKNEGFCQDATFTETTENQGKCNNAILKNTAKNNYIVNEQADFYNTSNNGTNAITNIANFYDDSINNAGGNYASDKLSPGIQYNIWKTMNFNDSSSNQGLLAPLQPLNINEWRDILIRSINDGTSEEFLNKDARKANFLNQSFNTANISGNISNTGSPLCYIVFNDNAYHKSSIAQQAIFRDNAYNKGNAIRCIFQNNSSNEGTTTECLFYNLATNNSNQNNINAIFYDNSTNRGKVKDSQFLNTRNFGEVEGTVIFSGASAINIAKLLNVSSGSFFDSASNLGQINSSTNIYFVNSSYNTGTIDASNTVFYNNSYNIANGNIQSTTIELTNRSYNNGNMTGGTTMVNSQNYGSIIGDTVLNSGSENIGYIIGNAQFVNNSINRGGIMGNVTLTLGSVNEGTITGNVSIDATSTNVGTVIGEITLL